MLDSMRLRLEDCADDGPPIEEPTEMSFSERDPNSPRRGTCLFPDPCDVEQEWEQLSE